MHIPSSWKLFRLRDITYESRTRAIDENVMGLSVFGVNNQTGLDTNSRYFADKLDRYKIVKPGMFAYNPMRLNIGSIGYCDETLGQGLVSPDYVVFGCKENMLNSKYFSYYIQDHHWKKWVQNAGAGSVRVRIYYKDISMYPITLPPLLEQRKIAEILSTWDEAIYLTEQLITTKQQLKRGVMQKLLSGKSLFPDNNRGKWSKKKLGDFLDIQYGKSPKTIKSDNGKYLVYGTGGVIGKTDIPLSNKPAVILGRKGTITQPIFANEPFWAIDTTFYCTPKDNTNVNWLYYALSKINFQKYNEGSTIPSLSRSTLYGIELSLPSPKTQKKIADFLSLCDLEIDLLNQKHAMLKQQKKGLMQKLLTGQIRVKV